MTATGDVRWIAPPSWPVPPAGWVPPPGWTPPVEWGPAPPGWSFWVDAEGGRLPDQLRLSPSAPAGPPAPRRPPTVSGPLTILPSSTVAPPRRTGRVWLVGLAVAVVAGGAAAATQTDRPAQFLDSLDRFDADASPSAVPGEPQPEAQATGPTATGKSAISILGGLRVKGRAPKTGYAREEFGPAWSDVDRNGCDTRNDVLARDLTATSFHPGTRGCVVVGGRLADPYAGRVLAFSKAQASLVQIDHVVSLSNAWQTGAFAWPASRRLAFANDPLNLLAVSGSANAQKSDGDAATWLPPNKAYRCAMVARQSAVKAKWNLWVTPPERDAIERVLSSCPGFPAPTGGIDVP